MVFPVLAVTVQAEALLAELPVLERQYDAPALLCLCVAHVSAVERQLALGDLPVVFVEVLGVQHEAPMTVGIGTISIVPSSRMKFLSW